jgi:hypothetical protein
MSTDLLAEIEELARKITSIDLTQKQKCKWIVVTEVISNIDPAVFRYCNGTRLISSTKVDNNE